MDPETECACAKGFGIHPTLFCSSRALARAATGVAHTQFARRMETQVVVATTWLPVGIGLFLYLLTHFMDL